MKADADHMVQQRAQAQPKLSGAGFAFAKCKDRTHIHAVGMNDQMKPGKPDPRDRRNPETVSGQAGLAIKAVNAAVLPEILQIRRMKGAKGGRIRRPKV